MPSVKFYYFDARGVGEIIRLLLKQGDIDFEDIRFDFNTWPEFKSNTPFGQLPVLEWDGVKVAQSNAIARFIAKKAGLYGKDEFEQLQIDSVVELTRDLQNEIPKVFTAEDKSAFLARFVAETLTKFLDNAEKFLKEHGGTYFVGNKLTWADIAVAEHLNDLTNPNEPRFAVLGAKEESRVTILKKYPLLEAHLARVKAVPAIKKWHESRKSDEAEEEFFRSALAARAAQAATAKK